MGVFKLLVSQAATLADSTVQIYLKYSRVPFHLENLENPQYLWKIMEFMIFNKNPGKII